MPAEATPEIVKLPMGREIVFGPFRLQPAQHLLLEGDLPVRIGARALDILVALTERPGELVTKDELVERVWTGVLVEEGNLRSQVALLRKAIHDGQAGARYIIAVPGRGYRFVAPVIVGEEHRPATAQPSQVEQTQSLPRPLSRVIGRDAIVSAIRKRLDRRRFITIVGPGGIGKTTVALSVANEGASTYPDGIFFIDLAAVSSSLALSSVVAEAFGLAVASNDPTAELIAFLRDRHILLVLDSCEHILEDAGVLAEAVLRDAPAAHVLATSREPLRAEGESVHHLAPLETPPDSAALTAAEALTFPAVALFVDRAASSLDEFELTDQNAAIIADICRKLDGMALAIELAAGRIDTFGLHGLARQLDDRFRLLMQGRRTALPRHRTLSAALDWSYQFLEPTEQEVLRRLAVFVGGFTLDAAQAAAGGIGGDSSDVVGSVVSLTAKSLVSVNARSVTPIYRLLDTTRAYAAEKLAQSGELATTARRHAEFYCQLLMRANDEVEMRPLDEWLATYGREMDNVREALDWALSAHGDPTLAVSLTIATLPLWMHFSLMEECRARVTQALTAFQLSADQNPRFQMQLQHALGAVLLNIEASGSEMETSLLAALEIAESLDETDYRLRILWCLWCHALNRGDFRYALALADRFCDAATQSRDPVDPLTGKRMQGFVFHFLGDQASARQHIEHMLSRYIAPAHRAHIIRFQFDQKITARLTLVHVLWLQGLADRAISMNATNIEEAAAFGHAMSLCNALTKGACLLSLMARDLSAAERYIEMLLAHSAHEGLRIWHAWGKCFQAILLIKQGAVETGLHLLQTTLATLPENRFSLRQTWILGEYAEGLRLAGRITEGLEVVERAIAASQHDEELWCIAELLRIKGELLQAKGGSAADQAAEQCFMQSLEWARCQNVISWELRTAMSVARRRQRHDQAAEGRRLLFAVYKRFTEGFDTADLQQSAALLEELSGSSGR